MRPALRRLRDVAPDGQARSGAPALRSGPNEVLGTCQGHSHTVAHKKAVPFPAGRTRCTHGPRPRHPASPSTPRLGTMGPGPDLRGGRRCADPVTGHWRQRQRGDPSEVTNCPAVLASWSRASNVAWWCMGGHGTQPRPGTQAACLARAPQKPRSERQGGCDPVASTAAESSRQSTSALLNLLVTNVILKPGHTARTPSRWESTQLHVRVLACAHAGACMCPCARVPALPVPR